MNILKGLYIYQSKKFPVKILFFTTLATVLCSAAVLYYNVSIIQIIAAFFSIMFFLFHVRVVDEYRDFKDDAENHPENPVHNGTISLKQLFIADIIGLSVNALISIYYGNGTTIFTIAFIFFTLIASKDFFIRKLIVKRNILYHVINSPQMILLQLYIFSLYTGEMKFTKIMWFAALFVYMNIFVLEVVRKIKIESEESAVADTYSKSMGFTKALIFNYLLSVLTFFSYILIINETEIKNKLLYILLSLPFIVFVTFSTIFHIRKKGKSSEKMLLSGILLMYLGLNILICICVI